MPPVSRNLLAGALGKAKIKLRFLDWRLSGGLFLPSSKRPSGLNALGHKLLSARPQTGLPQHAAVLVCYPNQTERMFDVAIERFNWRCKFHSIPVCATSPASPFCD